MSGECVCVEGVAGRRCDSCGRGYVGTFPWCEPCHRCFREWDGSIGELTNHTQRLVDTVEEMKDMGATTPYKDVISSLDDGVKQLREILDDDEFHQTLKHTENRHQQANEMTPLLRRSIDRSESDLRQISADHQKAMDNFNNLTEEAQNVQEMSRDKQRQVLDLKHSDPRGAMDSIREYYRESAEANFYASKATSDSNSVVKQSAQVRGAAKAKLDATEKEFNLKHELHAQRLDKITSDLDSKDLSGLSRQVCGGAPGPDGCGNCGGLGCVDEEGVSQCGGEQCETLITQTHKDLNRVKNFDHDILQALREVDKLNKMVTDARGRADEAKISAQDVLLRANQSKARVEQTNDELRDLIQQIRDFLTNGTDPTLIEEVANEVLKLSLPVSSEALKDVTAEIRDHVARLTRVDDILSQTAEQAHTAENLLKQAQTASKAANVLKLIADEIKETLDDTERAQSAASETLKEVESDVNSTRQQISTVQSKTEATEFKLSTGTQRFLDLERKTDEVREKTLEASDIAEDTEKRSEYVSEDVKKTEQEIDTVLQPKYALASGLIDQNGGGVFSARQRAEQIRQEAKDLMMDATQKLQSLRELEQSFVVNQHTLVKKTEELEGLESEARNLLQDLSQKITIYGTCA